MRFLPKRALAGALAVLFIASAMASAQVMSQVPEDALVVLRVKNLTAVSDKLGKLMSDLGVAAMQPGMDKPLTFFQQQSGISKGLNAAGEMAVVFRDPAITNAQPDQSILLLIPVSDFDAFVSNFGEPKVSDGVTQVKMPKGNDEGYIARWGDYAAMSPSKSCVTAKPGNVLKVSGAGAQRDLSQDDVVIFGNIKALRAKVAPDLQALRDKVQGKIDEDDDAKMAKFKPVFKAAVGQVFATIDGFLRDTSGATFAVNFNNEGLNVGLMAEFEPGSYLANTFAPLKNSKEPLLVGLPAGKYVFFGGNINQPEVTVTVINDFAGPILKEVDAMGPEMKPARDYFDALMTQFKSTTGGSFGIFAPSGPIGQESLFQFVTVMRGDAAAIKGAQAKLAKSQQELMKAIGLPAEAYNAVITPNAKTIAGVSFDSIATDMSNTDPAFQQQLAMIKMIYGPQGVRMLLGEVSKDAVIMAMGVKDETLSAVIAAAKAGEAPLSNLPPVKSVSSQLPQERTAEFYIAIDQIVTTGVTYAKMFGAPINVQLPPDLPPIGATMRRDGTAWRIEGYVPTQLVQQLVSAGMQVYGQAQGGGGGGPGGR